MNTKHIVCPRCAAINRVQSGRESEATCGKCSTPVFPVQPSEVPEAIFDKLIAKSEVPVLVDFWAPWCGPCRMMAPQFEEAAKALHPRVRLLKVNTETEQQLGNRLRIQSIPTLALFLNGREIARQPGAMGSADIIRWVDNHL